MQHSNVEKFYNELLNSNHFSEDFKNKLNTIQNEKQYKAFIRDEILPLAKSKGYNFSIDDIISYDQSVLRTLSEEELENVTGGGMFKNTSSVLLTALTLITSGGVAGATIPKPNDQSAIKVIADSGSSTSFKDKLKFFESMGKKTSQAQSSDKTDRKKDIPKSIKDRISVFTQQPKSHQPVKEQSVQDKDTKSQKSFKEKLMLFESLSKNPSQNTTYDKIAHKRIISKKMQNLVNIQEQYSHKTSEKKETNTLQKDQTLEIKKGNTKELAKIFDSSAKTKHNEDKIIESEEKQEKKQAESDNIQKITQQSNDKYEQDKSIISTKQTESQLLSESLLSKQINNTDARDDELYTIDDKVDKLDKTGKDLVDKYMDKDDEYKALKKNMDDLIEESKEWSDFQKLYDEMQAVINNKDIYSIISFLENPKSEVDILEIINNTKTKDASLKEDKTSLQKIVVQDLSQSIINHKEKSRKIQQLKNLEKSDEIQKLIQELTDISNKRNDNLKLNLDKIFEIKEKITQPWEDLCDIINDNDDSTEYYEDYKELFKVWSDAKITAQNDNSSKIDNQNIEHLEQEKQKKEQELEETKKQVEDAKKQAENEKQQFEASKQELESKINDLKYLYSDNENDELTPEDYNEAINAILLSDDDNDD